MRTYGQRVPGPSVIVICCAARPAAGEREELVQAITEEEHERRARFLRAEDADRFLVGRGTLRRELARWLAIAPRDVPLELGPHGKPRVVGEAPHVNVSHSGDVVIVALAAQTPIGVDVEEIDARRAEGAARVAFTARENRAIAELPESVRLDAFFHAWTSREAVMKAVGLGFRLPRDAFDVSVDPRIPPAVLASHMPDLVPRQITLRSILVPARHVATLAVLADPTELTVTVESRGHGARSATT